jgi:hypothetical protein
MKIRRMTGSSAAGHDDALLASDPPRDFIGSRDTTLS